MKPGNRIIAGLAFAAVCLTAVAATARAEMNANTAEMAADGPQTNPGDARGARSGLKDVGDTDRYEWLVHSNPNFRAVREPRECGPTGDAPLHVDCTPSLGR